MTLVVPLQPADINSSIVLLFPQELWKRVQNTVGYETVATAPALNSGDDCSAVAIRVRQPAVVALYAMH